MKLCEGSTLKVPAVVISDPYTSIFQVLAFAKERGAMSGERIAVNLLSEDPNHARLYTKDALIVALQNCRVNDIMKTCIGCPVKLQIGTKEPRVELLGVFTGTLGSHDRFLGIKVDATTYLRKNVVHRHKKPIQLTVHRHKVAFIAAA